MTDGAPLVRRLLDVVDLIATSLEPTALLEQLSLSARELFGSVGAAWCAREGDRLRIVTAAGLSTGLVGQTFPVEGSGVGALLESGRRSLVSPVDHYPYLNDQIYGGPDDQMAIALASVGGEVLGALYVTLLPEHRFGPDELEVLELLASHAGMAVHHVSRYSAAVTAAQELEAAQDLFLATASHELRTPLTVLRGFGETLLRHWDVLDDPRRRELVERMLVRSEGMSALVEQVLSATAAGLTTAAATPEPFDLAAVTTVAARLLAGASTAHPLVVRAASPVTAVGRPETVPALLDQLVENAVKYSPDGGTVEVEVRGEPDAAVLTVADRGRGIRPADAARVFDRFQRGEQAVGGPSGAGLGLWIVRRTVEAQGGSVAAAPRAGGGTVVTVRLPRADEG